MSGTIEVPSSPPASSNEYGEEDLEPDTEILMGELEECLTNIETEGSFALFEALKNAPNPGLCLKDTGIVGLPLSARDAQAIVSASHEAPFGKGEETIVDTTVRKTWEVSPSDFELQNPAWQPFIESIVAKVSRGLGVDSTGRGVAAELYKLLLYEKGAMFKPHQDSEKAPRMFATLVIALPSKHEGGEVRVTHAGRTEVFETSKFSGFDCSYLAWFADVTHEVRPVVSGYRLVLTYNLRHTWLSSKALSAKAEKGMAKLRPLFREWKVGIERSLTPTTLAFLLDHQYTDANLCYEGLKGHDLQVAAHLRKVCIEYGFCFFLASFERSVSGGCDEYDGYGYGSSSGFHELDEEIDKETHLTRIVDLDGSEVARDLEFKEELIIQEQPFEGVDPDREDFSGFTGNEGVSATHFYHRTVAILVARSHRIEFFLSPTADTRDVYTSYSEEARGKPKVIVWLDRLTEEFLRTSDNDETREELEQICKMVIRQTKAWKALPTPTQPWRQKEPAPFSSEVLARVVTTTVNLDSEALFLEAYHLCSGKVFPSMFQSVGTALLRYNLKSFLPTLSSELENLSSFTDLFNVTEELRAGLESEARLSSQDPEDYLDWVKSEVNKAILSMELVSANDGAILVGLSKQLPSQEVFNKILPAVKRNVNHTLMAMAFLTGFFDARISDEITESVAHTIFKDVISDLVDKFSLLNMGQAHGISKRLVTASSWESHSSLHLNQPKKVAVPDHDSSKNIATLLCNCLSLGLETELDQLTVKLLEEAMTAQVEHFEDTYLPFLKILIGMLQEKTISAQESGFRPLFQMILGDYIVRYVRHEPQPPKNWARLPVTCGCMDCGNLNAFLRAPDRRVGRFAVNKQRRAHLHQKVEGSGMTTETERLGSPQTLVITKNLAQHQAKHKAWKQRYNVARNHIQSFGTELLREYLSQMYDPILSLCADECLLGLKEFQKATPLPLTEKENGLDRVLPPITKRKIPADVVVLSD